MTRTGEQGRPVRCICFDFDGTVVDSFSLVLSHYARIAPKYGCRVPNPEEREQLRGLHAKEILARLDVPYRRIPQLVMRLRDDVRSELMDLAPVPGIRKAVATLAGAGFRLGVVSSQERESIRAYLAKQRITGLNFVATSNVMLGKAKVLVNVARSERIRSRELLYVGDELRDLDAARKAGCRFAAVAWGYTDVRTLEHKGADLICRSPTDLVSSVTKIDRT